MSPAVAGFSRAPPNAPPPSYDFFDAVFAAATAAAAGLRPAARGYRLFAAACESRTFIPHDARCNVVALSLGWHVFATGTFSLVSQAQQYGQAPQAQQQQQQQQQ